MLINQNELEQYNATKRSLALRLPSSAHGILSNTLQILTSVKRSPSWALSETSVQEEIDYYSSEHMRQKLTGPRPLLRKSIGEQNAETIALKIDAGLAFIESAATAHPYVKPIQLYYGVVQLAGAWSRAFVDWKQDKNGHGLECTHISEISGVSDTQVTIAQKGFFPRLSTTLFLMKGMPSRFTELVAYKAAPVAHTGVGEVLENFCKCDSADPTRKLTLSQIATYDFHGETENLRSRYGYHKFYGFPQQPFLIDIMSLFLASSLARYNVVGWREVLEGKSNNYRIHFEQVFERTTKNIVPVLLESFENPFVPLDRPTADGSRSPYQSGHPRFGSAGTTQ